MWQIVCKWMENDIFCLFVQILQVVICCVAYFLLEQQKIYLKSQNDFMLTNLNSLNIKQDKLAKHLWQMYLLA